MFKKKVVSLLCAAAMVLTAFSGISFAEDPSEPTISLIAQDASVQPYEDAVYDVVLNPNGNDLTALQATIQFDDAVVDYADAEITDSNDNCEIVNNAPGKLLLLLGTKNMTVKNHWTEETTLGQIKFAKVDPKTDGEITLSLVDKLVGVLDGEGIYVDTVDVIPGEITPVQFEYKAELKLDGAEEAQMGYDYELAMSLENAEELAENGYPVTGLQFDVRYDTSKFYFNKLKEGESDNISATALLNEDGTEETGVVRVVILPEAIEDAEAYIAQALGTLVFKAKVAETDATASFDFDGAILPTTHEDGEVVTLPYEVENQAVTMVRTNLDALMNQDVLGDGTGTDGKYVSYAQDETNPEKGKVSVLLYDGVQDFGIDTLWNTAALAEQGLEIKIVDKDGNRIADPPIPGNENYVDYVGTTRRFIVTTKTVVNEGLGEDWEIPQDEVVLYDVTMRIKGDVVVNGEVGQYPGAYINVNDLSALKQYLLNGISADVDEDIVWAATNINFPAESESSVYVYDLAAVRDLILA